MTYPLGKDPLEGKPCETCPDYATNCAAGCTREGDGHDSDCATHDAPAYPTGECDCSAQDDATQYNPWRAHIYAAMEGGSYFGAQDWNDLLAYMNSEHKKIINLDDQVKQLSSMVRQYETALIIKNEEHGCCAEDLLEARKDSERLDWLMRNVSGKEFRRLGVTYGGNCGRDRMKMEHREIDNMLLSMIQKHFPSLPLSDEHTDWGKWLGFARAVYEAGRASPASALEGWKHSCNALCLDGVELWIPQCPHCGKPAPTPPVSESVDPVMTKEELIAAAESIGMRFPGASIPPVSEDRWLPIETAPKDEFVLLAGPSGYTTIETVFSTGRMCSDYHVGRWIDHANDDLTDWGFEPTHWMPLPKAPAMQEDKP